MPSLTLTLTDDDWAGLEKAAQARQKTPSDLALHAVRREVGRATATRHPGPAYKRRATDRLARLAALVAHIKQYGPPRGQVDRQRLAQQLGVSEPTVYRDVRIALEAIEHEAMPATVAPTTLAPPGPPARIGRPPKQPRYKRAVGAT